MTLHAVIPLFPRFTALDGIGPYEVLQRTPDIDVTFIGTTAARSDRRTASSESPAMPGSRRFPTPT